MQNRRHLKHDVQCDQVPRLFFQNLAICNNESMPTSIKRFTNFAQYPVIILKIAQGFYVLAKAIKVSPNLVTLANDLPKDPFPLPPHRPRIECPKHGGGRVDQTIGEAAKEEENKCNF